MSRILCLDVGAKHTGVAVTDETQTIARSLPTIHHRDSTELLAAIRKLLETVDASRIVVGLPLNLSGNPTARSRSVERFSRRLERASGKTVELFDESLSTVKANEVLDQAYGRGQRRVERPATGRSKTRRKAVDRIAATVILQEYLASRAQ